MYEENFYNYWVILGNYIKYSAFNINVLLPIGKIHVDNYMDI